MKYKRFLPLLLLFGLPVFAEYQQQGFSQYQEVGNSLTFICESQCLLLVGDRSKSDYLSLKGSLMGSGVMGYGFLVGQQVAPGDMIQVNGGGTVDQTFVYAQSQVINQVPRTAQVVLIFQGQFQAQGLEVLSKFMSVGNKLSQGWKDFWTMEPMTPYSINLRYGVKIHGISLLTYAYWIALLACLGVLIFWRASKEKKLSTIFLIVIGGFLLVGIRNSLTYFHIVRQGITQYTQQSPQAQQFFDLGDYIATTSRVRDVLHLDDLPKSCTIKVLAQQDWPFVAHWEMLYLKPCTIVRTGGADYILYYHMTPTSGDLSNPLLLQFNGSYLLQNK